MISSPLNCIFDQINLALVSYRTSLLGPYDFCDTENADGIVESSHKNGIYCITQKVTEIAKIWINKSKAGQYT